MPSFLAAAGRMVDRAAAALSRRNTNATRLKDVLFGPQERQRQPSAPTLIQRIDRATIAWIDRKLSQYFGDRAVELRKAFVKEWNRDYFAELQSALDRRTQIAIDSFIESKFGIRGTLTQLKFERIIANIFTRDHLGELIDKIDSALAKRLMRLRGDPQPTRLDFNEVREAWIERNERILRELADDMWKGKISPEAYRDASESTIRKLHLGAAILGAGGVLNLSANHARQLEQTIAEQLGYMRQMYDDVKRLMADNHTGNQRDVARAGSYAQAAQVTAEQATRQFVMNETDGEALERRLLGPCNNCPDCIEYAAEMWVPVGTLPPLGDSRCGHSCCCSFEYSLHDGIGIERELRAIEGGVYEDLAPGTLVTVDRDSRVVE